MKITSIVPMLATGEIEESIRFYREVLGFELKDKFESGGKLWWCEISRDGCVIMLTQHEVDVHAPGARVGFAQTSINVYLGGGIEELHERLVGEGRPVSELRVTFYGVKEFDLKDPSGYAVLVGQPTSEPPSVVEAGALPF